MVPRLAAFVLLSMLVPAHAAAAAVEPYPIYAILSQTGNGAFLGKAEAVALQIVEENVNNAGGIAKRPVHFVISDDQSNPQVAVQLANDIIAKNAPPIIIGPSLVASCSAIAPLLKNGPVLYCLSAGRHPVKGSYEFTFGASTIESTATNIRYFREHGMKKFATITTTDASGQDADHGIDEALALPENRDLMLVTREHFNGSDVSVVAQIARIKASGAQYVITEAVGAPLGTILHAVSDVGLDIPILSPASNEIYTEMKQFAAFLPKQLYFSGVYSAAIGPEYLPKHLRGPSIAFHDSLTAHGYHVDISYLSWDPAMITIDALKKIGLNATALQIKTYIDNLHGWVGVNGEYDFRNGNQRGLDGRRDSVPVRWDADKDTWVPATIATARSPH